MTLTEIYHHRRAGFRRLLEARQSAPRNLTQYDQTVGYWGRFARNDGPAAAEPALAEIGDETCNNWLIALAALPGRDGRPISVNTLRKHCTHLQAVLDYCGPRSRVKQFQASQGLIADVPVLPKPSAFQKEPDDNFSIDEITAILAQCHAAIAPRYLTDEQRPRWWSSLFRADYNLGLRVGSLVDAEWSRLKQDRRGWWLTVVTKGRKEKRVYVNRWALEAIDEMRPLTGGYRCIWHWPHQLNWLHTQRRLIVAAANLPPDRRLGFHGFRKAMVSEVSEHDPLAGQMQAGHSNFRVTQEHYVNPKRVASGMEQLPQPRRPDDHRQGRLF